MSSESAHPLGSNFVKLWCSQSTSLLGVQLATLAIPLVALEALSASDSDVALISAIGGLPWILFGLFSGVVVDQLRNIRVLITVHTMRVLILLSIPLTLATGAAGILYLYVAMFSIGTLAMIYDTAARSALPLVVGESPQLLARANARLAATGALARIAGPGISGFVVQAVSAPISLIGAAIAHAAAASSVGLARRETSPETRRRTSIEGISATKFLRSFTEGLRFLLRHRILRSITACDGMYMFFYALAQSLTVVFLNRHLGMSAATIGVIFTIGSMGGVLGALLAGHIGRRIGDRSTLIMSSLTRSGSLILLPAASYIPEFAIPIMIASRFLNALGWTMWEVHQETTQQRMTPADMRGRVISSTLFTIRTTDTLGAFYAAAIVSIAGMLPTISFAAIGACTATLWLIRMPNISND